MGCRTDQQAKPDSSLSSRDGEEGFPGNLDVTVVYTFTNQNELVITYSAITDQRTIVNLTHHAFFNLAGLANPTPSVENNIVTINADFYIPMDEVSIPTGEIAKVEGTPMDFRTPHTVGSRINEPFQQLVYGAGYDHCYVLNKKEPGTLTFAAKCVEPESGRSLEVYTLNRAYKSIHTTGPTVSAAGTEQPSPNGVLSASKHNISRILPIRDISRRLS